ncbi:MAG TPA: hypothetical protein PKK06_09130 [Phycisphaerae bacterium]|nr:hypothetical protein [Phycisphaerae bacterium]HNU45402.1 hypothetical protein [Phycisphaerae bacterium]
MSKAVKVALGLWWCGGMLGWGWAPATAQVPDALDEALALAGLQRQDLGWTPKGWWPRFPADIPYKHRAFDSLFREPLDNIAYARSLAHAAREHLDPATLDADAGRTSTHLYLAAHLLGVNPKFGGMRGYTANLLAKDTPLEEAILAIYDAAGRTQYAYTFAMELPYPKPAAALAEQVQAVPEAVRPILGKLIMNIIDAQRWAELAFRNVPGEKRLVVAGRFNAGEEQVDAWDYCPEFDDVARAWDEASLWYASEKCVQALDDARIALRRLDDVPAFAFDWETPWGWIRIRGSGDDVVEGTEALLVVDLGGDDRYTGAVAAGSPSQLCSLLLDCGGNDRYESQVPAQGAGLTAIGVLLDAAGNDTYTAERYAQGVGQFGFGMCADLGGDDSYFVKYSGQGCGYFGIGLLCDAGGKDRYRLYADGQGLGGVAGVGILADRSGDDSYEAVRDAKITGRPSYHSPDQDISVNNAQGCAMGRRGDGADGHSWAGGLGALLDSEGDDHYVSGNWTMGTGYWFGIGMLHDGGGDDVYQGVCYSQATGAHFCIGVLVDEGGDDVHQGEVTSNMCVAWGHDFTIALLVNLGGDDVYDVKGNGISYSINRSVTALIDVGGDDRYIGKAGNYPGQTLFDKRFAARGGVSDYFAATTSLGLFLDVGGEDRYETQPDAAAAGGKAADATQPPAEPLPPFGGGDNTVWSDEPGSDNMKERNFSIGVDRALGEVHLEPRAEKTPSRPRVHHAHDE